MPKPTKLMNEQIGNSCAAHCTEISIAELLNVQPSQNHAEGVLWNSIKFQSPWTKDIELIEQFLASKNNSDPRRIIKYISAQHSNLKAKLLHDDIQQQRAITFVPSDQQTSLNVLYNTLKNFEAASSFGSTLTKDYYYNCSYTMHKGATPSSVNYDGLHNILVFHSSDDGKIYYCNPNEKSPSWQETTDWKNLQQSDKGTSYVFAGIAVQISKA